MQGLVGPDWRFEYISNHEGSSNSLSPLSKSRESYWEIKLQSSMKKEELSSEVENLWRLTPVSRREAIIGQHILRKEKGWDQQDQWRIMWFRHARRGEEVEYKRTRVTESKARIHSNLLQVAKNDLSSVRIQFRWTAWWPWHNWRKWGRLGVKKIKKWQK